MALMQQPMRGPPWRRKDNLRFGLRPGAPLSSSTQRSFQRISETGAVISEFSPFTPPMAYQFPMRNRIIVGLSSGVLVVEAALKAGL